MLVNPFHSTPARITTRRVTFVNDGESFNENVPTDTSVQSSGAQDYSITQQSEHSIVTAVQQIEQTANSDHVIEHRNGQQPNNFEEIVLHGPTADRGRGRERGRGRGRGRGHGRERSHSRAAAVQQIEQTTNSDHVIEHRHEQQSNNIEEIVLSGKTVGRGRGRGRGKGRGRGARSRNMTETAKEQNIPKKNQKKDAATKAPSSKPARIRIKTFEFTMTPRKGELKR